jgi:light-harvesting complex I chlorophyll a/b binding protein 1
MIKTIIITTLLGYSAAFSSVRGTGRVTTTALQASELEDGIGAVAPLGYFDPLGYITDEDKFNRYRAVERKHGRIAMMAMLGTFVHNNKWTFDGYLSPSSGLKFSNIDSGIAGILQVPPIGLAQVILFCGFVELFLWPASELSGDYGIRLGSLNDWSEQPAKYYRQKNAELNNGRAAMMGFFGIFVQEIVTGQNLAQQFSTGHFSPFGDGQGLF